MPFIAAGRFVPRSRPLRWVLGTLLLTVAVLAACEIAGWPFLRAPLAQRLQTSLGRDVAFGEHFRLRLLGSVRLATDALTVGSPPDTPTLRDADGRPLPFLAARDIALAVTWRTLWTLLRGSEDDSVPTVRELRVQQLDLALARDAEGNANWQLGPPRADAQPAPSLPAFGRLEVAQGRLRLDDAANKLDLDARLSTREGAQAAKVGGLEVTATGRLRGTPLRATFRSSGLLPLAAPLEGDTPTVPVNLDLLVGETRLQVEGRGGDLLRLSALDAQVSLSGPSMAPVGGVVGVTLPSTGKFSLQGRVRKAGPVWNADVMRLDVGSSRLEGDFEYDPRGDKPRLAGKLGGTRLALADLAPAVGAGREDTKRGTKPGRVLPQHEFDLPSLARMDADVAVDLKQLDLGDGALAALQPLEGRVRLQDGVLRIDGLRAGASGGQVRGALSLDARPAQPRWHADLDFSGVQLERFLLADKPRAEPKQRDSYLSGTLGGRLRLDGRGRSTAAMLASLDGTTELWIRGGRMSSLLVEAIGLDLAESLGVMIAGDDGVAMRCAVAKLAVHNGIVLPEVAVIDTTDSTLIVGGDLSLVDERLALKITARPHDVSPMALRAPVHVAGTFAKPQVKLEAGKVGLRAAAAVALASAVGPLASLLALADLGKEERAVCDNALGRLRSPKAPDRPTPARDK
jgi:uncharacterized protein involved in outer membrane biogenesis